MSWDVSWKLRWSEIDEGRFEEALRQELPAHPGAEARLESPGRDHLRCIVKLSETDRGEIDLIRIDAGEPGTGAPFEVLTCDLESEDGPTNAILTGICTAGTRAYVVSDRGDFFSWDGTRWAQETPGPGSRGLYSVWGLDETNVWAVGERGGIFRRDRGAWTAVPGGTSATLFAVAGRAPDDAWAAGEKGTLLHWDGARWSHVEAPAFGTAMGLWLSRTDLWLTGSETPLLQMKAGRFTEVPVPADLRWPSRWLVPPPSRSLRFGAIGGAGGDLWLACADVALRWNGTQWLVTETGVGEPAALWPSAADDVILVGDDGEVGRWDGHKWARIETGTRARLNAICWGPDGELLVATTSEGVLHLEPRGPWCVLSVDSGHGGNRDSWDSITEIAGGIARRLGAGPAR